MLFPAVIACIALAEIPATVYVLRTDTSVWDVAAVDLNGDGRKDVAALCSDSESDSPNKYVAVFECQASGVFPTGSTRRIALDASVGAVFFAQTDDTAAKEVIALNHAGARGYRYGPDGFEQAFETAFYSLIPSGAREPLFIDDTASDLDGDGIDEWLLPVPGGYEMRRADGLVKMMPCGMASEVRRLGTLFITNRLPAHRTFELSGATQKGVVFLSDEVADFYHGENWSQHVRYRIPQSLEQKWDAGAKLENINGDGFPDLVVTQTQGTIRLKVLTQVYLSESPFHYPGEPSATFETTGAISNPILRDVDGDGNRDLLFISLPFGVRSLVNYFFRNKLTVTGTVHLFGENGFDEDPSYEARLTLEAPEGRERVALAFGDFDGDSRLDVLYGIGGDKLVVYTGTERNFISSRPRVSLDLPAFGEAETWKREDSAHDDLLVYHPGGQNDKRIEVVLFHPSESALQSVR